MAEALRAMEHDTARRAMAIAIETAARRLGANPYLGRLAEPLVPAPYRFWSLTRFGYLLVYDPLGDPVEILRCVHTKLDLPRMLADLREITEPLPPPATNAPQQRTAARKRIIREVEDVIQRRDTEENEAERLHAEFLERLDDPDLDDEIADRPVADIIKDICRDLGIAHLPGSHPWKRRTPTEIATLAAWAAMPPPIESRASGKTDVVVPLWPYQRHSGETIPDPPPPH